MDNPATESGALDTVQAGALFANILDPQAEPEKKEKEDKAEPEKVEAEKPEESETQAADEEAQTFTVNIDGKDVELTHEQIADAYKNGLRQADYTKKTMETADQRKAAEAEISRAQQERQQYAQGLQQAQALLQAQLSEQSQIDWQRLLETDPVEYLKQQHLANARQAQLQQVGNQQQQLHARHQAEQAAQMNAFLRTQQDELLAKLPDWKDESKAKAERTKIREYLQAQGFDGQALDSITDHRAVILARKAMMFDETMKQANAAAKKVANLPQKVERPGGGENNTLDKRSAVYQRFSKSGKVEDAGAYFAGIL